MQLKHYQVADFSVFDVVNDELSNPGGPVTSLVGDGSFSDLSHVSGNLAGSSQVITDLLMNQEKTINTLIKWKQNTNNILCGWGVVHSGR